MSEEPLLKVRHLKKYFNDEKSLIDTVLRRDPETLRAVDDVSLTVDRNETLGIIGESGCGKSTLLRCLVGLHTPTDGEIYSEGQPMSAFDKQDWKRFRSKVQIVFQDPFNALNPAFTVRELIGEPLKIHDMEDKDDRVHDILEQVELQPPAKYLNKFPRQLSGGEKQRVAIARALVVEPDIILADEPLSMLDVSTQASILKLLRHLVDDLSVSIVYISHDLSTVSHICQRMNVMYLGRIVESAPTGELLENPDHPYSQALINAIPIPDPHAERPRSVLPDTPEATQEMYTGCRFRDRCPKRMDVCNIPPRDVQLKGGRKVACHLHYEHQTDESNNEAPEAPSVQSNDD